MLPVPKSTQEWTRWMERRVKALERRGFPPPPAPYVPPPLSPVQGSSGSTGFSASNAGVGQTITILSQPALVLTAAANVRFRFDLNLQTTTTANTAATVLLFVGGVERARRRVNNNQTMAPVHAGFGHEMYLAAGTHTWDLRLANDAGSGSGSLVSAAGVGSWSARWY